MKEITGDVWKVLSEFDALCITTNGFVTAKGKCVMGRGIALAIKKELPRIDIALGNTIKLRGNVVSKIGKIGHVDILSFPVKPKLGKVLEDKSNIVSHMKDRVKVGTSVPGWMVKADITIIKRSAKLLAQFIEENGYKSVLLPRPGCGAGELNYEDVKEVLNVLDDKVTTITFGEMEEWNNLQG